MYLANFSILFCLVVGLRALRVLALFIKIKGMPIFQIITEELLFEAVLENYLLMCLIID